MTKEDKDLLLKDLCMRLPYGVIFKDEFDESLQEIHYIKNNEDVFCKNYPHLPYWIETIKPYLRPMSSMTDEEKRVIRSYGFELILYDTGHTGFANIENCIDEVSFRFMEEFLNAHHFDYHGLIEKGLAIEVTKENNPYESNM